MSNNSSIMTLAVTVAYSTSKDIASSTSSEINPYSNSSTFNVLQGLLYGITFVFGSICNSCIIFLIHRNRSLHTTTYMWVTSLCISQLLICLLTLPIMIITVVADQWLFGFYFCQIFGFYTNVFRTVSILSVAAIAIDRHHVITRPFNPKVRKSAARKWIALAWWSAVVASVPPLFGIGFYGYSSSSHMCGLSLTLGGSSLAFIVFYFLAVYVSSLLVVGVAYMQIYQVTSAQASKRKRPSVAGGLASGLQTVANMSNTNIAATKEVISPAKRRLKAVLNDKASRVHGSLRHRFSISSAHSTIEHRAAHTIILVLLLFVIIWLPFWIFALYASAALPDVKLSGTLSWLEFLLTWLTLSNAVWDPMLYGFFNKTVRTYFTEWMHSSGLSCLLKSMNPNSKSPPSDDDELNSVREVPIFDYEETTRNSSVRLDDGRSMSDSTHADERRPEADIYHPKCRVDGVGEFDIGDYGPVSHGQKSADSTEPRQKTLTSSARSSKIFFIPSEETYTSDTVSEYNDTFSKSKDGSRSGTSAFLTNATVHCNGRSMKMKTRGQKPIGYQSKTREYYPKESSHLYLEYTKQLRLPDAGDRLTYDGLVVISDTSSNTIRTRRRRSTADHPGFGDTSPEKRAPLKGIRQPEFVFPQREKSDVEQCCKTSNSSTGNKTREEKSEGEPHRRGSGRTSRTLKSTTYDI